MRALLSILIVPPVLLRAAGAGLHLKEAADYASRDNGHALLVMVNGKIVLEQYYNGHTADKPHHLASATKTFWGPVVAAMIEDKLISSMDELAADTLTEWKPDPRKSRITIRHLTDLTAGLAQDIVNLQGHNRRTLKPDLFQHAVGLAATREPGETFLYGPSCYYALGALMKRKLASRNQTPVDYLKQRLLNPIGASVSDWVHDRAGNPHMPNGCYITARDWLKFGQLLLDGGRYKKKRILRAGLLRFDGTKANPGYGFTAWLNRPGGHGAAAARQRSGSPTTGWIYPGGLPDLYMAGGAGGNRLIMIPSRKMVIVRMGESAAFSDPNFLTLLFDGKPFRRAPAASADRNAAAPKPDAKRADQFRF